MAIRRVVIAVALVAGMIGAGTTAVVAGQSRESRPRWTHVVRPGETLWGLAGAAAPGRDRRETVDRLILKNGLDGGIIRPGQTLLLRSR